VIGIIDLSSIVDYFYFIRTPDRYLYVTDIGVAISVKKLLEGKPGFRCEKE